MTGPGTDKEVPPLDTTTVNERGSAVIHLDRVDKPDDQVLGGKAARLAELIAAGLPIPPAFCVSTAMFRQALEHLGIDEAGGGEPGPVLRRRVLDGTLPAAITEPILAAYAELGRPRVAVRSSAVREDSAGQSFAGQHDTILDVAGDAELIEAVKECWASLWSDRAQVYRDGPEPAGAIAVIVQEMIHADVSGVLFTTDPVSPRPHQMVVEACWGLGEGLVSGKVPSDWFLVDERTMSPVEQEIRYKVTKCAPLEPGRIGITKVDEADRNLPCLTRDQLEELARLAVSVRTYYEAEQDLEWVLKDGRFHLLQARPITTRPQRTDRNRLYVTEQPRPIAEGTLWSRMDIGEIFTGIMSPLGQSFARYYQANVHTDCARAVGVLDPGDPALHMGYLQGHIYLNISFTSYMLGQCPPTRDQRHFTARFASEEADLTDYHNPFGSFPGGGEGRAALTHWLRCTAVEMAQMKRRAKRMVRSREYEFDRARALDLTRLSRRELDAEMSRYLGYFHDMHVGYMPYYINAFGFYGVLAELCAKWLGKDGHNLQNRVKTDMSSLRTVESARDIWVVAQAAKDRPAVMRLIRETPLEALPAALLADDAGREFWKSRVEPFLRANGTRSHQEMELTHPRWIDDPSYVFQMIRRYAEDGFSIDEILGRSRAYQDGDAAAVLTRLPRTKRTVIEKVIAMYVQCSELRETARMSMITSIWLVRNVVYEVGRRLIAAGVLRSPDEVAYLDFGDVLGYLSGTGEPQEVFSRVRLEEARREFQYVRRLPEPPLTLIGEHDPTRAVVPAPDGARLEGLAASPGRAVGRARVIEDLVWQADEFQAGEILVTRFTDASWTPLFAIAGGVVTDIGSMLSHSSIVAREFNVPSVVNTKQATRRIATGDMVVVDGDAGVVEVVEG